VTAPISTVRKKIVPFNTGTNLVLQNFVAIQAYFCKR